MSLGPEGFASASAISAAVNLAQAFGSEIESLFIEDQALFDATAISCAREIVAVGRGVRPLSADVLARDLALAATAMHREVAAAATAGEILIVCNVVRDSPIDALAQACAINGPWNVVAMAHPEATIRRYGMANLFATIDGTTGFVLAGLRARPGHGPVVAMIEEVERVAPMLRAAERLAAISRSDTALLVVSSDRDERHFMEGQVRLALGSNAGDRILGNVDCHAQVEALAAEINGLHAAYVVAQFGADAISGDDDLLTFVRLLHAPLFLVR